jgi:hypothetical protein
VQSAQQGCAKASQLEWAWRVARVQMKFPPGAKSDTKARMLGSLFLLNQLYFEGGNQGAAGA